MLMMDYIINLVYNVFANIYNENKRPHVVNEDIYNYIDEYEFVI